MTRRHTPRLVALAAAAMLLVAFAAVPADAASAQKKAPPAPAGPTTPMNLRVTAITDTSVSLAWDASTAPPYGVRHYVVTQNDVHHHLVAGSQTTTSIGLPPGTTHTFKVRAVDYNYVGSAYGNTVSVTMPADTSPPTTPNVAIVAVTAHEITLRWPASTDNSTRVDYDVLVDGAHARDILPTWNGLEFTIMKLEQATTHQIAVRAFDPPGNATTSDPVTVTTAASADITPPSVPANIQVSAIGASSATAVWGWTTDNVGIQTYRVHVDGAKVGEVTTDIHYPGDPFPFFRLRHLPPGTTSTLTVTAVDAAGNVSAPSAPKSITTLPSSDTTPPGKPTITHATSENCAWLSLWWNPVSDNADTANQITYEIYEDGRLLVSDGSYYGASAQASFGTRSYVVVAVDRAGNSSAPSAPFTVRNSILAC